MKVLDENQYRAQGSTSVIAGAIVDGADPNGSYDIDVLNNSYGWSNYDYTFRSAIIYTAKKNRVFVAAKGNDNNNELHYPADYYGSWVISVGATDQSGYRATWGSNYGSNYGNGIDVVAPGKVIYTTNPSYTTDAMQGAFPENYGNHIGTSFAAPQVSGLASLILSQNSSLHPEDVQGIIRSSVDDKGDPGYDDDYGEGRINAGRAMWYLNEGNLVNHTVSGGSTHSSTDPYTQGFYGYYYYIAKRYDVRKTITLPQSNDKTYFWPRGANATTGWTIDNPVNEEIGFCEVIDQTSTIATLRTYVYELWSWPSAGTYYGFYPCPPGNVNFAYTTLTSPHITTSGTLTSDETWFNPQGNSSINITGNVTVPAGKTLTILPGTKIKTSSGKGIIINGTLNAVGTSETPIVFESSSGSWGGIDLISSSSSVLEYCEIIDAYHGIYIYNGYPHIAQCYIHDNTYGSYVNYLADPVFYYNTFSDNAYGIKCYNSDAHFGEPHQVPSGTPNPGYNDIIDNNYGLFATQNSYVFFGMDVATQAMGGYNSLDENSTIDILATSSSSVSAEYNWWGLDGPDCYDDGTSYIYTYNALSQDPNGGSALAKISSSAGDENTFNPNEIDENNPEELLHLARYNKNLGLYKEALDISEKIINNYPETNYAVKAMLLIYSISRRSNIINIENYCQEKINTKESSAQVKLVSYEILISKYMLDKKNELAKARCNDILNNYQSAESEKYALFNLFLMSYQDESKSAEATEYKSELEEIYPDDPLTLKAKSLSGENVDWSLAKEAINNPSNETTESLIPSEYALHPAYPNPFNPSTTLSFDLPEASKVNLEIYNIQGQKVWSSPQNNIEFSAGNHSVVWKGVNSHGSLLPSGMYFVHFGSGKYHSSQKLLLLK
jgi:parallel beta-helix repeat protein